MKPIDLGALQDAHNKARATEKAKLALVAVAATKLLSAQTAFDRAKDKAKEAATDVNDTKSAMLEGARTLANN